MMQANQMTPMPTVSRSRLRSATDEPPSELETPPPNMSDSPPPRPLCSRTSRIIRALVMHEHDGEEQSHGQQAYVNVCAISEDGHVVEPADAAELVGLEARAADEAAVDVRLRP